MSDPSTNQKVVVELDRDEARALGAFADAFAELSKQRPADKALKEALPLIASAVPKLRAALSAQEVQEEKRCERCHGTGWSREGRGFVGKTSKCPDCSPEVQEGPGDLREQLLDEDGPVLLELREALGDELEQAEDWRNAEGEEFIPNDPAVEALGETVSDRVRAVLARNLSKRLLSGEDGDREGFVLEYFVNDHTGIHGPMDQESAETLYRQLAEADPPPPRAPILEFRWVGPRRDAEYGDTVAQNPLLSKGVGEDGAALIAAERRRQVEAEGWTPEHDDAHDRGELAMAAAAYAIHGADTSVGSTLGMAPPPGFWPFESGAWKPSHRARDLIKAGALIAAEIDRLQRLDSEQPDPTQLPGQEETKLGDGWRRKVAVAFLELPADSRDALLADMGCGSLEEVRDRNLVSLLAAKLEIEASEDQEGEDGWPELRVIRKARPILFGSLTGRAPQTRWEYRLLDESKPLPPGFEERRYVPAPGGDQ